MSFEAANLARDRETLRRYLLGELGETERDAVEERYLFDEEYAGVRDEVEIELVDAYVGQMLSPEERRHFEEDYAVTDERRDAIQAAWMLQVYRKGTGHKKPVLRFPAQRWYWFAVAAAVAAAFAGMAAWNAVHRVQPKSEARVTAPERAPAVEIPRERVGQPAAPPQTAQIQSGKEPASASASVPASVPEPAPVASPAPASDTGASLVDGVVLLARAGRTEESILEGIRLRGRPASLSAADLVRLKEAGASDLVIEALGGPGAAPAPVPPVPAAEPACPPLPPASVSVSGISKRKVAVQAFDYSAVKTSVTAIFGNDVNIGQGIRSMLEAKLAGSKSVAPLEVDKPVSVMAEQDLGTTSRVRQGSAVRAGGVADAILLGDIVIFGRDDSQRKSALGAAGAFSSRSGAAIANSKKNGKAVVTINLRIVDAGTGEVLATTEARGESTRTSTDIAGLAAGIKGGSTAARMTSPNFAETILGEATQDAVNKMAAFVEKQAPAIPESARVIDGSVANVDGCTLILTVGGNDGVRVGDRFEVSRIMEEILDPGTKEVLDRRTEKVGEAIVTTVRDRTAAAQYSGLQISLTYSKGYTARLIPR